MKNKGAVFSGTLRGLWQALLLAAALACLASLPGADKAPAPGKLDGFVYDSCGGCFTDSSPCKPCKVVLELESYLYTELERLGAGAGWQVQVHNVLYEGERELLAQRLSPALLQEAEYPVLVLDGVVLQGWGQVRQGLAPALLARAGREAPGTGPGAPGGVRLEKAGRDTVVYFKLESCGSCRKTDAFLDGLLQKYSHVELLPYEIDGQGGLEVFQAYCRAYGLDPDNTFAPVVFVGDRCLEGLEGIQLFLGPYLEAGYASGTYRVA